MLLTGAVAIGPERALAVAPACPYAGTPMPEDQFWGIIDATTARKNDPDAQGAALADQLGALTVSDLEAFELRYHRLMQASYNWDVWGAVYVVEGGASDDGFEYFRSWLIAQGRAVYDAVTADPDSLADHIPLDAAAPPEFEGFAYIAGEVWSEKTGRDANDSRQSFPSCRGLYDEPGGVRFEENPVYLSSHYPRLWKRFGQNPLG